MCQVQLVVNRLIEYQKCANGTQSFIEDKDKIIFKGVTQMNKELLEHLVSLCALIGPFILRVTWKSGFRDYCYTDRKEGRSNCPIRRQTFCLLIGPFFFDQLLQARQEVIDYVYLCVCFRAR